MRLALKHGDGALRVAYQTPEAKTHANGASARESTAENGWVERVFNTQYACPDCKTSLAEIEPRTFSFNSPYGACPACDGLATREGFVPELVLPDLSLSLAGGAVAPWRGASAEARAKQRRLLEPFLTQAKVDWETPLEQWPRTAREQLLHGDGGKFPGLLADLEMDFAAANGDAVQDKLAEFRGPVPCPACGGSRLRPEARACRLGGLAIHEITALPIDRARRVLRGLDVPAVAAAGRRAADRRDRPAAGVSRAGGRSSTSRSTARPTRSAAARCSACGWPPASARGWSACCTFSTSRRSACTRATTRG